MTQEDDETPENMPPRDIERDVLAERRARRGELQGDSMLARRAELAEETARTLEGRLSGIQERLREAERECASATERLVARERELRSVSERLVAGERELRSVSSRLTAREQELRSVSERLATREQDLRLLSQRLVDRERELRETELEIHERIEGLEARLTEFQSELASERATRIAAERELSKLQAERERVESILGELKSVAKRLREVGEAQDAAASSAAQPTASSTTTPSVAASPPPSAVAPSGPSIAPSTSPPGVASTAASIEATAPTQVPPSEVPSSEVPSSEVPPSEVPSSEAPSSEAPSSEVPSSEAPPSEVPSSEVPSSEVPSSEVPSSEAPPSEAPVAETSVGTDSIDAAGQKAELERPQLEHREAGHAQSSRDDVGVGRPSAASTSAELADAASRPSSGPDASTPAQSKIESLPGEQPKAGEQPSVLPAERSTEGGGADAEIEVPVSASSVPSAPSPTAPASSVPSAPSPTAPASSVPSVPSPTAPAGEAHAAVPVPIEPTKQPATREGGAKGIQMAEALASAVERLRARVASVGELNERREAALATDAPDRGAPYAPPVASEDGERRAWLAPAIRQMAEHGGGRLAGELIIELLPAQAKLVKGTLRYLLRIEELGGYEVELADGSTSVRGVDPDGGDGPSFDTDFTLEGPAAAFAEFAGGGVQRRPRGLRVPGRRRRARRLFAERRRAVALTDLVGAELSVWPGLLLAALAESVDPAWTITDTFTVAFSIEGRQSALLDVGVRAGMPLRVSRVQQTRGAEEATPVTTVRLGERGFLSLLAGTALPEGEQVLVQGDSAALERLLSWTDRVQGIRRFGA
jgi:hypothetical protein